MDGRGARRSRFDFRTGGEGLNRLSWKPFAAALMAVMIPPSNTAPPIDRGAEMCQAFMSIEKGFTTYSEGMTRVAENAQLGDPGACRRR